METSLFVKLFGNTPLIRIVDFLIENSIFDYTKTDIAENAGIARASLYKIWPIIELFGIVKENRKIGNTVLYSLNKGSPIVQQLLALDLKVSKEFTSNLSEEKLALISST